MKIDQSGWDQPGLFEKRRGRPKKGNSLRFKTVGMTDEDWRWLSLWMPGASPTSQLAELVERAKKFWPAGPTKFR